MMRLKTIGHSYTQNILCYKRCPIVQILSNKQSVKVICRFDRLTHSKRQKKPSESWKGYQLPTYLNYIVLRTRANPSLINYEDLTMALIRNEALNAIYMQSYQ